MRAFSSTWADSTSDASQAPDSMPVRAIHCISLSSNNRVQAEQPRSKHVSPLTATAQDTPVSAGLPKQEVPTSSAYMAIWVARYRFSVRISPVGEKSAFVRGRHIDTLASKVVRYEVGIFTLGALSPPSVARTRTKKFPYLLILGTEFNLLGRNQCGRNWWAKSYENQGA